MTTDNRTERNLTINNRCASNTYFVEFGATAAAASQDCLNEVVCCVELYALTVCIYECVFLLDDDLFRFVLGSYFRFLRYCCCCCSCVYFIYG